MFTVRIIYPNHFERITPALTVTRQFVDSETTSNKREEIAIEVSEGVFDTFDEGVFYIMNDSGATVAKYILGKRRNEETRNKNDKTR